FADNDIAMITGGHGLNPVIRGRIMAANTTTDFVGNGLVALNIVGGRFDGATISTSTFDSFWYSARYASRGLDPDFALGDLGDIHATSADFFRSRTLAVNVGTIQIVGGAFDASSVVADGDVGTIMADEFRNTTRLGEGGEFRPTEVRATGSLGMLATNNR